MDVNMIVLVYTLFTMFVLKTRYTHGTCSPDTNSLMRFGSTCKYLCHCKNVTEQCDTVTGTCTTSGCANAYMGPGCQYRDIASFALSQHSSNIYPAEYSDKAKDGDMATCSRTSTTDNNPWWRIWLPRKELMTGLVLVTEKDKLVNFQMFNITVENDFGRPTLSSSVTSQHTCYSYSGEIPPSETLQVTCHQPKMKNQVRVRLVGTQKQLVICDIRVYGGKNLAFGKQTSQSTYGGSDSVSTLTVDGVIGHSPNECSATKQQNQPWWSIDLGHIMSIQAVRISTYTDEGLLNFQLQARNDSSDTWITVHDDTGKTPPTRSITLFIQARYLRLYSPEQNVKLIICEVEIFGECIAGRWGPSCDFVCGSCIKSETCSGQTGHCPHGCQDGYEYTTTCKAECVSGTFGDNCSQNCSDHCKGGYDNCNKINGTCELLCEAGWKGVRCDQECEYGRFGENCIQFCGHCLHGICDRDSGNCTSGCMAGYKHTTHCVDECINGSYGMDCERNCSENCQYCNKADGQCECKEGWEGEKCNQACTNGTWGYNCNSACGNCLTGPCDRFTGYCSSGCQPGYKPTQICNDECDAGTFGQDCSSNCSERCIAPSDCKKADGRCESCILGWRGNLCEQECSDGTYGISCLGTCGNCNGGIANCEKLTGACVLGCAEGFVGYGCIKALPASSSPQTAVVGGVSAAAAVVVAVAVVVIVLILRRRHQKMSRTRGNENQLDALPSVSYNTDSQANKYDALQVVQEGVNPYDTLDTTEADTNVYEAMEP